VTSPSEASPTSDNQLSWLRKEVTVKTLDEWVMDTLITGGTDPVALRLTALAIREYGQPARDLALERRREYRLKWDAVARRWQHTSSRRMTRGNHHDSWIARESYVRGCGRVELPANLSRHASQVWRTANPDGRGPSRVINLQRRARKVGV
jgi:hypothetical protein